MLKKSILVGTFLSLFTLYLVKRSKGSTPITTIKKDIMLKTIESPSDYNQRTNRKVKDVLTVQTNNPGAIFYFEPWQGLDMEYSGSKHLGKIAHFTSFDYGVRAQLKTLITYQKKHGLRTTSAILNRYAPPNVHNNQTGAYVKFVSDFLGVDSNQELDFKDPEVLSRFGYAQHIVEAGFAWVDFSVYLSWAKKLV